MTGIALHEISVTQLHEAPWNPRKHYDPATLDDLAASIREKGVIEPIIVRQVAPPTEAGEVRGGFEQKAAKSTTAKKANPTKKGGR